MGLLDMNLFVNGVTYVQGSDGGTTTMLTCVNIPKGADTDLSGKNRPGFDSSSPSPPSPQAQAVQPTDPLGQKPNPAFKAPGSLGAP
jgi:hypothetical protein